MSTETYVVIMAGGSGTRFWPMSRKSRPKQLLSLVTEKSLLLETVTRIAPARVPYERVIIVTGDVLAQPIRKAVGPLGVQVLVEPMARNTAPCIAYAAAHVAEQHPEAVMAVLPADHHIEDATEFCRVFDLATEVARGGRIVTLGIKPDRPETGYGYTRRGEQQADEVYAVDAFVEKPDLETAKGYLEDGRYDWNSGMFFMRADVLLDAVQRDLPKLHEGIEKYRGVMGTPEATAVLYHAFEEAEPISIDYGVMEKEAGNISVVPADFGWSDLGSWRTLLDFREPGESNFTRGDVDLRDSEGSVVVTTGPHVAVIGARNLAVVATGDAVLVAPLDRAQEVGQIPKDLSSQGKEKLT